jgi:uncharacterized protein YjbJ (UPF0337 family)
MTGMGRNDIICNWSFCNRLSCVKIDIAIPEASSEKIKGHDRFPLQMAIYDHRLYMAIFYLCQKRPQTSISRFFLLNINSMDNITQDKKSWHKVCFNKGRAIAKAQTVGMSPAARGPETNRLKPKLNRRNTMKSGTRDQAEGKMHQVKGKIKEVVGKVVNDKDLEIEGKVENLDGKVQEKVGEIKKIVEK